MVRLSKSVAAFSGGTAKTIDLQVGHAQCVIDMSTLAAHQGSQARNKLGQGKRPQQGNRRTALIKMNTVFRGLATIENDDGAKRDERCEFAPPPTELLVVKAS